MQIADCRHTISFKLHAKIPTFHWYAFKAWLFDTITCRRQEPAAPLLESLADRLRMLEQPQLPTDPALNGIVQSLPPEVPFN